MAGPTYGFKSTPNNRFFEKLFMAIFHFTLRVFARNLLRGNRQRNIFRISFWCLAWDLNPGFSSNKPTHYLLDHGNYHYRTMHKNIDSDSITRIGHVERGHLRLCVMVKRLCRKVTTTPADKIGFTIGSSLQQIIINEHFFLQIYMEKIN